MFSVTPARVFRFSSDVVTMTEPTNAEKGNAEQVAPAKTVNDLKLEKMESALEEMKAKYEASLSEMQKTNEELWAQLHPVKPTAQTPQETGKPKPAVNVVDKVYGMVLGKMGIKECSL